jgi:hypothetical protein
MGRPNPGFFLIFNVGTSFMKGPFTLLLAFCLILLLGCNGTVIVNKPLQIPYSPSKDTAGISSPNNGISSFVITAADNPGILMADVHGSILFDTVKLIFDKGTNLNNLVPTIGIVGKSISPASKTAENFDSTLVYTVTATDGSMLTYLVAVYFQ